MTERATPYHLCLMIAVLTGFGFAGCKSLVDQPLISFIEVTSPINTTVAVGRDAQLTAVAKDASQQAVGAAFVWTSSDPAVATVTADDGLARGVASGDVVITAEAQGRSGTLVMRVVDADLNGVGDILADPLRARVATHLTTAREAIEDALTNADDALAEGDLVALNEALTSVRAAADAATNADDRALLATLALLTDFATRMLNL